MLKDGHAGTSGDDQASSEGEVIKSSCGGAVRTLRGQNVLFTGTVRIRGEHYKRDDLDPAVRNRGGTVAPDRSRKVTLLVLGDLDADRVVDPVNVRSQKLVYFEELRRSGHHTCIVDGHGLGELLDGRPARCLETTISGSSVVVSEGEHPGP